MANYREDIVDIELTGGSLHRSFCNRAIGAGDEDANRFGIRAFRNGQPETISGSVMGLFVRSDGGTVTIESGTVSGNVAYVTLPAACYAVEGNFTLAIKITSGSMKGTMRIVDGTVSRTSTDAIVDPGTIIPSVEDLIEAINNAVESIPQDYSAMSKEVDEISGRALIQRIVESAFVPLGAEFNLDQNGTRTNGKAWKKDKSTVDGNNYCYITYTIPSSYWGGGMWIWGHGWGEPYPLACFYDSSMNLLAACGNESNTEYSGYPFVIPKNTANIIINGRSNDAYKKGVAFYSPDTFAGAFTGLRPAFKLINSDFITLKPNYADVKNLPENTIYALGASIYSSMTNLPAGLNTYATIIKFRYTKGLNTYCTYLCINEFAAWIGFENASRIAWHLIYGQKEKQYLFIGDSYCEGYSHDGNNSGWGAYLAEALGLSQGQYEIKYQGGKGFANGGFLTLLNAATSTNLSDIVVMGGFNDNSATSADILSAIQTFCNRCRALYPEANIWIGCVGWIKEGTGASAYQNWETVRGYITDKVLPAYQSAPKYGAKYINMVEYLLTDDLLTNTDGYHPGEAGNKAIAKGVANGLNTGTVCLPFKSDWKG